MDELIIRVTGITEENKHQIGEPFEAFVKLVQMGWNIEYEDECGVKFHLIKIGEKRLEENE